MTLLRRFRAHYGAGPLHLLTLLASFAIAGAAVAGWFERPGDVATVLVWFAAAIVIHDLVLLPLYSLLDRIAFRWRGEPDARAQRTASVRLVNPTPYIRIPAILSGLLLLVFFPVILGLGAQTELAASGIAERGYLARWLLATGVMFALSGAAYAVAATRAGAPPESGDPDQAVPAPRVSASDQTAHDSAPDPIQTTPGPAETAQVPVQPEPAEATQLLIQPEPTETASGDPPAVSPAPE